MLIVAVVWLALVVLLAGFIAIGYLAGPKMDRSIARSFGVSVYDREREGF
jgi:ABC-type enterobactin transport system permease subunit